MRNAGGYSIIMDPVDGNTEADTFTCFHCQFVVTVPPKADPANIGGLCKACMKLVCPQCVGGTCKPFLKQLDEMESRYEARRSYGF